ncbi:hypothetical protein CC85DRAFT_288961 [Cutaneotrichosporon oleaginosum]|uniref:CENP-V/GFA domain-containing protein n=1 Tax=Cutaneotrichosporon oleaginosum TaxID=879819 RepID=A0A0J0XDA9_9TREE|nr:uncharacterized protein CC85DRAFT_288961 [Cutaneotrichosporon oleaginosum]KLT39042.1 hypothetical protein CC85DRAFT_288961 [Cutaneotrichosporon oleaginosum]TXT03947.1 hypothetical protein COLE_07644 [Cutaneotrichosporon oleaginosum]
MPLSGSCLCGAVTVTIKDPAPVLAEGLEVCGCTDCRQFTGCARGAEFLDAQTANVEFKGADNLKMYEKGTDAGNKYKRHFCGTCGSSVYDQTSMRDGKQLVVHAGGCSESRAARRRDGGRQEAAQESLMPGVFPPGSLPKPSVYIWRRSAEEWDAPLPGVMALDKQDMPGEGE